MSGCERYQAKLNLEVYLMGCQGSAQRPRISVDGRKRRTAAVFVRCIDSPSGRQHNPGTNENVTKTQGDGWWHNHSWRRDG